MIIVGAKGHAEEVLQLFTQLNAEDDLYFFDNMSNDLPSLFHKKFRIVKSLEEAEAILMKDKRFVLGIGNPQRRHKLAMMLTKAGGKLQSIISPLAAIGKYEVSLGEGLNVMTNVIIYNNTNIGEGCLLNSACSIHHGVIIGRYTEISPGARLLGNCSVGEFCQIGSNAVVLPNVRIGSQVIIGAGAVVTNDIPDNTIAVGIPARVIKKTGV